MKGEFIHVAHLFLKNSDLQLHHPLPTDKCVGSDGVENHYFAMITIKIISGKNHQ